MQQGKLFGLRSHPVQRHLVGTEGPLDGAAIELMRSSPALGGPEDDRRPACTIGTAAGASLLLEGANLLVAGVQRRCERLVHAQRVIARDEMRLVSVAFEHRANGVVA